MKNGLGDTESCSGFSVSSENEGKVTLRDIDTTVNTRVRKEGE